MIVLGCKDSSSLIKFNISENKHKALKIENSEAYV
jgi:hypothetical protein